MCQVRDAACQLRSKSCLRPRKRPEPAATGSNVACVTAEFDAEVTIRRQRFANPESGFAVLDAESGRRPGRPGRAADPSRGARARARRRRLGQRQPIRRAGQGLRGPPAAARRRRDAVRLSAARQARRSQAGTGADRSLRRRAGARRDRSRPGRRFPRGRPDRPARSGGRRLVAVDCASPASSTCCSPRTGSRIWSRGSAPSTPATPTGSSPRTPTS